MKNILIFVPHPDDEVNLVGNCIDKIKELGNIYIIYSSLPTDIYRKNIRKKEALNACKVLGINKDNVIFLDYPETQKGEKHHFYTDGDKKIEDDIYNLLKKYKPIYIFGTDFDYHPDHRMLSLALDNSINKIVKNNTNYYPIVLKGFCYETAYYGLEDYSFNLGRTKVKQSKLSNCTYEWENRISISSVEKNCFIWNRKAFKALSMHKSQYAILHAKSIINSDNVFWLRRTDNLMNKAYIEVSSGDKEKLNDFMILDTNDIIKSNPNNIDYSKSLWIMDDNDLEKNIKIKFKNKEYIKYLIIHGELNNNCKIKCDYKIIINDKDVIKLNELESNGRITCIDINKENIDCIKILFENKVSISEIEIYSDDLNLDNLIKINDNEINYKRSQYVLDIINNILFFIIVLHVKIKRKIAKYIGKSYY